MDEHHFFCELQLSDSLFFGIARVACSIVKTRETPCVPVGQIDRKPKECVDACGCMFHPELKTGIHTPVIPCTSVLRFDEQI